MIDPSSIERAHYIDEICDAFEALWRASNPEPIEDFMIKAKMEDRQELLCELIAIEMHYRRERGEKATVGEYARRFPELPAKTIARLLTSTIDSLLLNAEGADEVEESEEFSSGDLDDYELLDELGRGGIGVVYKARHKNIRRIVAVKVLLPTHGSSLQHIARFRREAVVVAQLHHPNIVQLYTVGNDRTRPYLVLEYVDGGSLNDLCRGQPIPPKIAAMLLKPIADAVHYAHTFGIVHRDLKPSNILVCRSAAHGNATESSSVSLAEINQNPESFSLKVTDYGLAKLHGMDSDLTYDSPTQSGQLLGTPSYMSPEQASGKAAQAGPSSDVYSLGAVLYSMLTGRPPFFGESSLHVMKQVLNDDPIPPSKLVPKLPKDLETICMKCLMKEAPMRYSSAKELHDDLDRFLSGQPILARPIHFVDRSMRWVKRKPVIAALSFLASALFIAAASIWINSNIQLRIQDRMNQKTIKEKLEALSKLDRTVESLQKSQGLAQRRYYAAQMSLASQAFHAGEIARAYDLVESVVPAEGEVDFRGFEWNYLRRELEKGLVKIFQIQGEEILCIAFSPDGTKIGIAGEGFPNGTASVWSLSSGELLWRTFESLDEIHSIVFSPDGKLVCFGCGYGIMEVHDFENKSVCFRSKKDESIRTVSWSPDGKWIVAGCQDGSFRRWKVDGFEELPPMKFYDGPLRKAAFSKDSKKLFTSGQWGNPGRILFEIDVNDAEEWKIVEKTIDRELGSVAPDGKTLGLIQWGRIHHWDYIQRKELHSDVATFGSVTSGEFSADGKQFGMASGDERLAVLLDLDFRTRLQQHPHRKKVRAVAFDPTGKYWASGSIDGEVRVWKMDANELPNELVTKPSPIRMLVANEKNGIFLGGGFPTKELKVQEGKLYELIGTNGLTISGDGTTLASGLNSRDPSNLTRGIDRIDIWNISDQTRRSQLVLPEGDELFYLCVKLSQRGDWLATRAEGKPIRIWDIRGPEPRLERTLSPFGALEFSFSPDDKILMAAGENGRIVAWDLTTGENLPDVYDFDGRWGWAQLVVFSQDGKYIAAGNDAGQVVVVETSTGNVISHVSGHLGEIRGIAFFPDNQRIVVTGIGDIRIWDFQSSQELLNLPVKDYKTMGVAVVDNGATMVTMSDDGVLRFWRSHSADDHRIYKLKAR